MIEYTFLIISTFGDLHITTTFVGLKGMESCADFGNMIISYILNAGHVIESTQCIENSNGV